MLSKLKSSIEFLFSNSGEPPLPQEAASVLSNPDAISSTLPDSLVQKCLLSYATAPPITSVEHPVTLQLREQTTSKDCIVLNNLIKKVTECPASKKLWEEATAKGPINLFLAPKSMVPSRGFWEYQNRNLAVDRALEPFDNKLSSLTFELCNAKSDNPNFIGDLKSGKLSSKEFARKMFYHEDRALNCQHKVAQACHKSNHWDPRIDLQPDYIDSKAAREKRFHSSHSNYVKANMATWERLGKLAYCDKNPHSSDCLASDL